MKKYITVMIIIMMVSFVLFTRCKLNRTAEGASQQKYFEAVVLSVDTDYLLVEPNEGTDEKNASDKIQIGTSNITDEDSLLYLKEAAVGDKIQIGYSGEIMETYPAMIDEVFKISVLAYKEEN